MRVVASRMSALVCTILGGLAATAAAGTIVVKPGTAYPTIQSGCDAAHTGDIVSVTAGTYHESVVIPLGRSIELRAKGKVIVDGRGPSGSALGPGFRVFDGNFKISGFEFHHQTEKSLNEPGIGILLLPQSIPGTGTRIVEDCVFENCLDDGVFADGGDTKIRDCVFRDIDRSYAINISGSDCVMERCEIIGCRGVLGVGDRMVVRDCDLRNIVWIALNVSGLEAVIEKNVIDGAQAIGIKSNGKNSKLRKNRVSHCGEAGMFVLGDGAELDANVVDGAMGYGIRCDGTDVVIHANQIRHVGPIVLMVTAVVTLPAALYLVGAAANVSDNRVEDCSGVGISVTGNSNLVSGNRVTNCGASSYAGIQVSGVNLSLTQNEVSKQSGDGFYIDSATATLADNVASQCSRDGFDVNGLDIFATRNTATKNGAEGFDVNVVNVFLVKNTAKGNRIDIATVGSIASFQNNHYETGGPGALPEIE